MNRSLQGRGTLDWIGQYPRLVLSLLTLPCFAMLTH